MVKNKNTTQIDSSIEKNQEFLKSKLGIGVSFDVGFRELVVLKKTIQLYYVTGLVDTSYIIEIMKKLISINDVENVQSNLLEELNNRIMHQQISKAKTMDEAIDQMLSGLLIIFMDGESECFIIDVRHYPGRAPQEPDTEKVVRGSRDGYTENIIENTALTRRRIRDDRLRHEIIQVGERSKTDICISYLQDVADQGLLEVIKAELNHIDVDGLSMADKTVEEYLVKQGLNPYPMVRYTERPDVASTHLLEGHILIMVDTSPSMIIMPTTYFHHVQHAEEYRESPAVGTFIRWVRFCGIAASLFLLPLWLLLVLDPSLLPENLQFIGPNETGNIPIVIQIILADIGIEFLRMAAIHTPTPLSTAMGLIAAVLIGEIAIEVGLFSAEVILYVAISAIGTFATPSYELSVANKMARILLVLVTFAFQVKGLVIGFTLFLLLLISTRSLQTPYLWPFIPFNDKALWQILFRVSMPMSKTRPSIVRPKNNKNQA
ncbi:stage V sporulation protein AF [Gracilibacillus boraciitolerans JCM 21714]|uniref:Stage V sporulation protein AF n=1 Tax=Gracilibacillus boraciitolerans JCM 21714 TaxID=1298598 RepID=W4VER9_9BACI|nr:spore germination protein [Gracilibacillus boraciitolerans]GAE91308.1 stage V sporulation protein AF [Gracilibacillus boraciitolerans JCM 21714]